MESGNPEGPGEAKWLGGWRNPGGQEKVEVVEQVLTMKVQVGLRHLGGIWESKGFG